VKLNFSLNCPAIHLVLEIVELQIMLELFLLKPFTVAFGINTSIMLLAGSTLPWAEFLSF
jgi:hypothetical protein